MTPPTAPVPVTRVRGGEPRVSVVVAIGGLALALAVLKPWAPGSSAAGIAIAPDTAPATDSSVAPAAMPGTPATMPGTAATETPGLLLSGGGGGVIQLPGSGTLDCADPQGWRVVLDATTGGLPTRTWVAVDPGPDTGPLDPATPLARIVSGPVARLGFCAPVPAGGAASGEWSVGVWRLERDGPGVGRIERDAAGVPRVVWLAQIGPPGGGLGGLLPAAGLPGAPHVWAPGEYALGLQAHGSGAALAWLVVELVSAT